MNNVIKSTGMIFGVMFLSIGIAQANEAKTNYCDPNFHSCEAPFTAGNDHITSHDGSNDQYCNPNLHSCEAPFTAGKDKIAPRDGADKTYCNPGYHSCEAPFTIGKDHINL